MKIFKYITAIGFVLATVFSALAQDTFVGTIRTTMGNPVKGVKVYVNNPKQAVKSDKNGEFKFDNVNPTDSIHIEYKKRSYSFAVNDRQDMMIVAGHDDRLFDRNEYTGESFHAHLVDYKGDPIRGAIVYVKDPYDYVKTDKEGTVRIDNVKPTDTLRVKYNGDIHDIAIEGNKGMYIKITRKPLYERKDAVIVDIGAGAMDLRDYNGPYTMLNAKQLDTYGESSLTDAVRRMPGVTVDNEGNISVRGTGWKAADSLMGSSNQSSMKPMWIIDGTKDADPESVDVKDVEVIVLLKDGGMWGSRAAGGVFIVTTKHAKFLRP